jgi:hypothetical protein
MHARGLRKRKVIGAGTFWLQSRSQPSITSHESLHMSIRLSTERTTQRALPAAVEQLRAWSSRPQGSDHQDVILSGKPDYFRGGMLLDSCLLSRKGNPEGGT